MAQADELLSNYDKLQHAEQMLSITREQMDKLTAMGDNVSSDDLMGLAERLVGEGLEAQSMAMLLTDAYESSDNGTNPQRLAEWIRERDEDLQQREAHLKFVMTQQRHQMATTGLQMLGQMSGQSDGEPPNPLASASPAPAQPSPLGA